MPKVVHFEVSAKDIDRASTFYRNAFDWNTQAWDGPTDYLFLLTGEDHEQGIHGAVVPQSDDHPPVMLTVEVGSVEDAEARVANAGGKVLRPNQPIPGLGRLAYVEDTEGNRFGVLERAAQE